MNNRILPPVCLCTEAHLTHIINNVGYCSKCGCMTQEDFNRRFKEELKGGFN